MTLNIVISYKAYQLYVIILADRFTEIYIFIAIPTFGN